MLETPRISKYSSVNGRKVKIFDRCGQSAGNLCKQRALRDYTLDPLGVINREWEDIVRTAWRHAGHKSMCHNTKVVNVFERNT